MVRMKKSILCQNFYQTEQHIWTAFDQFNKSSCLANNSPLKSKATIIMIRSKKKYVVPQLKSG